jgi:hypothetical protein
MESQSKNINQNQRRNKKKNEKKKREEVDLSPKKIVKIGL